MAGWKASFTSGTVECADVVVPLDWNADNNGTWGAVSGNITFTVARYLNPNPSLNNRAVFAFAGGPGQDSVAIFRSSLPVMSLNYDADMYVVGMRGVSGFDSILNVFTDSLTIGDLNNLMQRLTSQEAHMLPFLTTDNACRDVMHVITETTALTNKTIYFTGHSYGTFLVHRFVQMYPTVVRGAILDSAVIGPSAKIMDMSIYTDQWWTTVLERCQQDAFCSKRFGPDPRTTLKILLNSTYVCAGFAPNDDFKFTMSLAFHEPWSFQVFFALMNRYQLCLSDRASYEDDGLMLNLKFLMGNVTQQWLTAQQTTLYNPEGLNTAALYHMRGSEFSRLPVPSNEQLTQEMAQTFLGNYAVVPTKYLYNTRRSSTWKWTAPSPYADKWASSASTFFFLISGGLDWNTPTFIAKEALKNLGSNAALFIYENGGHTTGLNTKCGMQAMIDFITTGRTTPSGCLYPALSFEVDNQALQLLGLPAGFNLYGDSYIPLWVWIAIAVGGVGAVLIVVAVVMYAKNRKTSPKYELISNQASVF
eukprot:TRINITY_DN2823_c0_g1_i1.p1 TRINITY_DN2823_c0_g1~~TRINITY_DN2823_c0_g1_i1.p1  ORF type:complete len:598 (+),score=108.90 TRINITY_DN2823_c0_g1_i1:196-1794(+)